MIDAYYKNYLLLPIMDGGITKPFATKTHLGVDFGWRKNAYAPIIACQEGVVTQVFKNSEVGNAIVIQHNYSDGTHRWTGYIHLKSLPTLKAGDPVKQGEQIGLRGNTGNSHGPHLHIYVSDVTTKKYTWDLMKSLCTFDPYPMFYLSKNITYDILSSTEYESHTYLEDIPEPINYPQPVERDEKIKQVEILITDLRLRSKPNADIYPKLATKGIYNVLKEEINGNYCWYLIDITNGNEFWIASGGTRTKDLLSVEAYDKQLEEKVNTLTQKLADIQTELEKEKKQNEELSVSLTSIGEEYAKLNSMFEKMSESNFDLQNKIYKIKDILEEG